MKSTANPERWPVRPVCIYFFKNLKQGHNRRVARNQKVYQLCTVQTWKEVTMAWIRLFVEAAIIIGESAN